MTVVKQNPAAPRAHVEPAGPSLVVEGMSVREPAVVAEARRWTAGHRGPVVAVEDMSGTDLSAFVTQALVVGSHAIATAGGVQEAYDLGALVTEVGERTTEASAQATRATGEAIQRATATIESSTAAVRTAIGEIGAEARRSFADNVETAGKALSGELDRLLGGAHPELLARLTPVLDRFGRELEARSAQQTSELIAKAARQFDPADPASPMAQHARTLAEHQQQLTDALARGNKDLTGRIEALTEAIRVAQAASTATAAAMRVSPTKGESYAQAVHGLLHELATGLGDEYADTSSFAGRIPRNKKGDGVLAVHGGETRVVVEMSDSQRPAWGAYLDEAERNRDALASLGLVRSAEQLGGHLLVSLGPRRLVLAFDPETDSIDLLRTVLQLLRLAAEAAARGRGSGEVNLAEEKIAEALAVLARIDAITKSVGLIRQHVTTISTESESMRAELSRLLSQAQSALGAATDAGADDVAA